MDVVYNVVRDLMLTDFGMESVWAMDARHAFLDIKGVETISANRIELHPAGLDALQRWLFDQRFTDRPEDRRLARLRDKANEAREDHAAHPWFHGRRINGASDESIPAWFDSGLLWAFPNVDAQQVILRPVVTKAAHGMNVTYFEMEKVNV